MDPEVPQLCLQDPRHGVKETWTLKGVWCAWLFECGRSPAHQARRRGCPTLPRRHFHPSRQEAARSLFVNFWRVVVAGNIWMGPKEHNKKERGLGEERGLEVGKTI